MHKLVIALDRQESQSRGVGGYVINCGDERGRGGAGGVG